ncbi:MAG: 4-hydroxy-tetrahydrodipicolinate synthase [Spirochaetaceae bacterium]|nr:4-hydroxy-tetrahydrodipicolinate synthase [Myxococcales bacterium]MCB9724015.1 4-hydroxy-tetrahydrodipicolinate synthase [Spirochaetaceae bacterium]HPG28497.1 4-hydroxy-tetrahydrodipicolinate synthase [Myxococcota bacterium]
MFEGIHTALVTPFRNGGVDEEALRALVERQIEAGIDGLVPCGSTGESATLSHLEHRQVVEIVIDAARGRVPVMAGTGSNSTREAIELTRHAKEAGASGALLLSPYYNKPTQEGIYAHYAAIASEVAFPLVVYNIPGRTASNIAPETIARLARLEHIVGVKEASGNLDQMSHVIAKCPADFAVLSGDDSLTLPLMAIGGKGVISTSSNIAPGLVCDIVRRFEAGDVAGARARHYELLPLFDVLFCETNPIPVKAAAAALGWCGGEIRLPLTPIGDANLERLKVVLKDLGILQ